MTEDEAKTKWCPFSRVSMATRPSDDVEVLNNREDFQPSTRTNQCIASACMAWRWAGYRAKDGTWVRKTADGPWDPKNADGFCGLAGAPQ